MEDLDFPICILKMNLQCCRDCPLRVKKLLQKVKGVYAITIDPKEGIVLVSGTAEPRVLIKAIEQIGKSPHLYAYHKDPTKANLQFRPLPKRYAAADGRDDSSSPAAVCCGGEARGGRRFGMNPRVFGRPTAEMQMIKLPSQVAPPGWLAAGTRPRYMVRYEQPVVAPRKPPAPYPFDFYTRRRSSHLATLSFTISATTMLNPAPSSNASFFVK